MKIIAEFVKDRITTPSDLQDALQTAMQLEFSTIPPYLCAQWSINSDPCGVADMIEEIVLQEMYHFALAGNMLTAIGGVPDIANASFIPRYPTTRSPTDSRRSTQRSIPTPSRSIPAKQPRSRALPMRSRRFR
jgi:hypothetical protein